MSEVISDFDAVTLGFPRDTTITLASTKRDAGKLSNFERAYLSVVSQAARGAGRDPARILVAVLPYASFRAEIYDEAARRYPTPLTNLISFDGQDWLLVTLSPSRMLALASGEGSKCGAPLVLSVEALNKVSQDWARHVLPHVRRRSVRNFAAKLPDHLSYLPALLKNAGSGGPASFSQQVIGFSDVCLSQSLPFVRTVLKRVFASPDPIKSMAAINAALPKDLIAMRPACLTN
ncbi:hypothetical protein [uncultured Sulfitobacter sp.]|uniref:hypothetical protein n=1 Tax=uncultured Sulfitobacter sp. TaxID=191468 RepID=UPI002601BAE8|nr:hypothetical protein [uncultured Sulfitobacter sp.]